MKSTRLIAFVAVVAFVCGFWTACSVGFDPTGSDLQFSCQSNDDCIDPNVCKGGVCKQEGGKDCVDNDGDGFGVGEERGDCDACESMGLCEEDCNDDDPAINPGAQDTCDGKDNDCDEEVDEPLECEENFDCPDESSDVLPTCENNECVYKPAIQTSDECQEPLACVDGMREDPPEACQ